MAMDPKQQRMLEDGTASIDDLPRRTDKQSVREQAENPPVDERPRQRRRTTAAAGVGVNLPAGTAVERMAREMGATPIPEAGRSKRHRDQENGNGARDAGARAEDETKPGDRAASPQAATESPAAVTPREARRTLRARREHSKGDGNFPSQESRPQLDDERPEDRTPDDLPKARDDRSAPKGNATSGQEARNPALDARDDFTPLLSRPQGGLGEAKAAADSRNAPRRSTAPKRPTARRSSDPKRDTQKREVAPRGRTGKKARAATKKSATKASAAKAPKRATRSPSRAASARKPQGVKKRTGTTRRGGSRVARGNVSARTAGRAKKR
ncbi:MAG TPA: hypothetical protein VM052_03865 [Candidatus Limnocylindrales bacterium]|nr:hypothetical protein [Candidatus Limnocylindrales bacterium]